MRSGSGGSFLGHGLTQICIYPGLITVSGGLEPGEDVRVQTHDDALLLRLAEFADDGAGGQLANFRYMGEVDQGIGPPSQVPRSRPFLGGDLLRRVSVRDE